MWYFTLCFENTRGTGENLVFQLAARKNFNANRALPAVASFVSFRSVRPATANILIIIKIPELVKKVGRLLFPEVRVRISVNERYSSYFLP